MKTRRNFIKTIGALGAGSIVGNVRATEDVNSFLQSTFANIGFDPTRDDSGFIVLLTDIHMAPSFANLGTTEIDQRIIDEVNNMVPQPEMLIVSGDLATAATEYTGKTFTALDETRTREELEIGMEQLARFNDNIELKIIPGNHDTYSYEVDAVLWREYTNSPPYFTFDFYGLDFIMLNSAHDGAIDAIQQTWFNNQVLASQAEEEIYVVGHHPLGATTGGRGINEGMKLGFANYTGDVWYSAGHVHNFSFRIYNLHEECNVVQSVTATASPDSFNPDGKSPGYSLICVRDGKVAHHFHRDVKAAQIVARPNPNRNGASNDLPIPFSELNYPLLICEEGKYARQQYIHSILAGDVSGTWWSYVDHLELDFDLTMFQGRAHQVVFLGSYRQAYDLITEVSLDGGNSWQATTSSVNLNKHIHVDLPEEVRNSGAIRLRLTHNAPTRFTFNFFLAGFALVPDPATITGLEAWRWENFGTIFNEGDAQNDKAHTENGLTNLEKFAFDLPVYSNEIIYVNPEKGIYHGLPSILPQADGTLHYMYVRRKNALENGIGYELLESTDLENETVVDEVNLMVTDVDLEWELVSYAVSDEEKQFFKVRLMAFSSE